MASYSGHPVSIILKYSFLILFCACSSTGEKEEHEESEHDHEHISGVVIEPDKAAEFGIATEMAEEGGFRDVIKCAGIIESSNHDIYTITAKKSGIITLTGGINQGVSVKSGERLATISSEGIEGGDLSAAAQANLSAAKSEYERLKPLFEEKLVTASVFREAERAYKEAQALAGRGGSGGNSLVVSPSDGVLQNLSVRSGNYVEAGTPLATVSKNTMQILKVELPARESRHLAEIETANFIAEGNTELIKLEEHNGQRISGTTSTMIENGYIPIYFTFTGNSYSSPGGFAEVFLLCGEREGVISLPRGALIEIQGNKYAYVSTGDHTYEKRLVKTGATDGERIEIKEGIKQGERVVTKGASIVRMAEVSAIAPPAHTHNH